MMHKSTLALLILVVIFSSCESHNKYSKEANQPTNFMDRQFRMAKINMIWEKAQKRLNANKLQTLFKDLKEQDKLEMALKKLKSENHDKNGHKEIETRSKLNEILTKYDLTDALQSNEKKDDKPIESKHHKQLFKDKNLDKLWTKALQSKFSDEELKILKEEFQHYEAKLTEYHNLIDKIHDLEEKEKKENEKWENSIEKEDHEHVRDKSTNSYHLQHLNDHHKEIKNKFFKLQDKVLKHVEIDKSRFFEEDDAENLWKAAQEANLDETELEIIKSELLHFEHRIKKLNYLHGEMITSEFDSKDKQSMDDLEENKFLKNKIKDLTQQVEKLKEGVETKIRMKQHSEL